MPTGHHTVVGSPLDNGQPGAFSKLRFLDNDHIRISRAVHKDTNVTTIHLRIQELHNVQFKIHYNVKVLQLLQVHTFLIHNILQ